MTAVDDVITAYLILLGLYVHLQWTWRFLKAIYPHLWSRKSS